MSYIENVNKIADQLAVLINLNNNMQNISFTTAQVDDMTQVKNNLTALLDVNAKEQSVSTKHQEVITKAQTILSQYNKIVGLRQQIATESEEVKTKHGEVVGLAQDVNLKADQVKNLKVQMTLLDETENVTYSYNAGTGTIHLGVPRGLTGKQGDAFRINAYGTEATKSTYNNAVASTSFFALDSTKLYFKISDNSGDWSQGIEFGKGAKGDDLTITSIDDNNDGTFTWHFSDSTDYVTPSLKGDIGATGPAPEHERVGLTGIRFKNPDGSWGDTISLDVYTKAEMDTTIAQIRPSLCTSQLLLGEVKVTNLTDTTQLSVNGIANIGIDASKSKNVVLNEDVDTSGISEAGTYWVTQIAEIIELESIKPCFNPSEYTGVGLIRSTESKWYRDVTDKNDDGSLDFTNHTALNGVSVLGKTFINATGGVETASSIDKEDYIEKLGSKTIVLNNTIWVNPDGVEYADEGLRGVPDTSFSSTGARLYPNGVIVGKSSFGLYIRYLDGRLFMRGKVSITAIGYFAFEVYLPYKSLSELDTTLSVESNQNVSFDVQIGGYYNDYEYFKPSIYNGNTVTSKLVFTSYGTHK